MTVEDIMRWDPTSNKGYFLEVDAEIAQALHDFLGDLPPFPESLLITEEMASPYTQKLRERRFGPGYKCSQSKLAPNLLPKRKHKVHIAALQQYVKLGGVITKVWRALEFDQSAWLRPYIEFNTRMRASSTSPFAKRFYKLMVNSYFGKTMEVIMIHDIKSSHRVLKCTILHKNTCMTSNSLQINMHYAY